MHWEPNFSELSLTKSLLLTAAVFIDTLSAPEFEEDTQGFVIYPNPTERIVYFNKVTDIALYDISGKRVAVYRNVKSIDISGLQTGTYLLKTKEGDTKKLLVK